MHTESINILLEAQDSWRFNGRIFLSGHRGLYAPDRGIPIESFQIWSSAPLLPADGGKLKRKVHGSVQVGIACVTTCAAPELLAMSVPLAGPSAFRAPLARVREIDVPDADTASLARRFNPFENLGVGPVGKSPGRPFAPPQILDVLNPYGSDSVETNRVDHPSNMVGSVSLRLFEGLRPLLFSRQSLLD